MMTEKNSVNEYSDPVLAYLTSDQPGSRSDTEILYSDDRVHSLIEELKQWPGAPLSSHKSSQQYFHKLSFLAEIGCRVDRPDIQAIVSRILESRDADGIPQLPVNIGKAYGGTGEPTSGWALCDAPTTLYSLLKLGVPRDTLMPGIDYLAQLHQSNGWGCRVSSSLGKWRGPGKKDDPCPYATLIMTKLFLEADSEKYYGQILLGAECLLSLWENSRTEHPYIFYMGTDFRKLKLPLVWYDILYVAEVLSRIDAIQNDSRFLSIIEILRSKAKNPVPESVYLPWKQWDFGQKKQPSAWLQYFVERILSRL